jgi:hypothetical protein
MEYTSDTTSNEGNNINNREYNFITLGFNCAPAIILKDLGLRNYSLPFDWIITTNNQIINCIQDDFNKFHKKLHFTLNNHWLMDEYGIQYPHDYPVNNDDTIIDDWQNCQPDVLIKYERRIERFKNIMNGSIPIIALYYGQLKYAQIMKKYMEQKYNKTIIFVVATNEKFILNNDNNIIICNVLNNDQSRIKEFWIDGINNAISRINNVNTTIPRSKKINKMFMKLF